MHLVLLLLAVPGVFFLWLILAWVLRKVSSKSVPAIYVQPGFYYPLKYVIFRVLLGLRKRQNERQLKEKTASSENAGYGVRSRNSPEEMDTLQKLPADQPEAVDAVYFNGGNSDGLFMVAATARRQENVVQTILYLRLPGIGLLELPSLPDTWLSDANSKDAYTAGGLTLSPVRPMEAWSLTFDGKMRVAETGKQVQVNFNLMWKAIAKPFDFDTDQHVHPMADGIARQTWSREYFDKLKTVHQTHYEQFGQITGQVHVDSYPTQEVKVHGVRDHSYGNIRDWKLFHRYALNYAYLEDGSSLCVGAISMPVVLSRLVVGYLFHPDGKMDPVRDTDFEFYDWGDDGKPPDKLKLSFTAGGQRYQVTCEMLQCPVFYMGRDWDAKIHERFCHYTVNGISGWGISEWAYRNDGGKVAEMKRLQIQ